MRINHVIDFCLDNKDMPAKDFTIDLIRFMENHTGYDTTKNNPLAGCKLDADEFNSKVGALLDADEKETLSTIETVELFEKHLTKKELAYLAISGIIGKLKEAE